MGHHITEHEDEIIKEMITKYKNNKINFFKDTGNFLIASSLLFYIIIFLIDSFN